MKRPLVQHVNPGFRMYRFEWMTNEMPYFHQHNDLELNIVEAGCGTTEVAGRLMHFERGHVSGFWSAVPHRVIEITPPFVGYSLSLPTPWVLHYQLPPAFISRLLH